ncbi:hypothetical protein [Methyloversatilis thermotolerans]|uniref:hypothetical protein n=1 Tax=Methyloversatilis thermotolerans TaxID=1346290 RepID=UPI00036CD8B3|nr:hypothetical protein [Methyloversatilis thermotolerans]
MLSGRLGALRLFWLLLCLIGAQHASIVHAFQHLPTPAATLSQPDEGSASHAATCPECLSACSLSVLAVGAAPASSPPVLGHVFHAVAQSFARHGSAPEPCAHDPPRFSLI